MNKKNYQKIMEDLIRENCTAGEAPSLLLHSCCAPVSYTHLSVMSEWQFPEDFWQSAEPSGLVKFRHLFSRCV